MSYRALVVVFVTFHTLVLPFFLMIFLIQSFESPSRQPPHAARPPAIIKQPTPPPHLQPTPPLDPSPEPAVVREAPAQSEWVAVAHVSRSTVELALSNLYELNPSLRILPYERDHRPVGVKLFGIRRHSILGAAGFVNGDVIHTINGEPVMNPNCCDQVLATPPQVVELGVTRRGRPGRLVVLIEDEPPADRVTQVAFD